MSYNFYKSKVCVLSFCLLLSGCSLFNRHSGLDFIKKYNTIDSSQLQNMSDEDLIEDFLQTYYYAGKRRRVFHKRLTSELQQRFNLSDVEVDAVEKRHVFKGMSEMALYLSWGYPRKSDEKSIAGLGACKEFVYGGENTGFIPQYIYLKDGKVAGWQFKRPRYRILKMNFP